MIHILFLFAFLFSTSHASIHDFCVADLTAAQTPLGYPCKPPDTVTVNDFVFSNLKEGSTSNMNKIGITRAHVGQFPGVNGLGISVARLDLGLGGFAQMHSHGDASELLIMLQGRVIAGFISSDNSVFVKMLEKDDVMVIPQGLLHFIINAGIGKAAAFQFYSDANPGVQLIDFALFGNNLDSSIVAKTTFLDPAQIKKLKAVFGGRG